MLGATSEITSPKPVVLGTKGGLNPTDSEVKNEFI